VVFVGVHGEIAETGVAGAFAVTNGIVADMKDPGRGKIEQGAGVIEDPAVRLGRPDLGGEHDMGETIEDVEVSEDGAEAIVEVGKDGARHDRSKSFQGLDRTGARKPDARPGEGGEQLLEELGKVRLGDGRCRLAEYLPDEVAPPVLFGRE